MLIRKSLLAAGVAVAALGAVAGVAAVSPHSHVISVPTASGSVEVRYTGDVAPVVTVHDTVGAIPAFAPFAPAPWAGFGAFDTAFAEMDRRADAMLRDAAQLAQKAQPGAPVTASVPGKTGGYSFVSTATGSGVCMRRVEVTSDGSGKPAKVVSTTSGDCGNAAKAPAPARGTA